MSALVGGVSETCNCYQCAVDREDFDRLAMMILCASCGNKRCPHATNHRHACTNSNDSGQHGSTYGDYVGTKPDGFDERAANHIGVMIRMMTGRIP